MCRSPIPAFADNQHEMNAHKTTLFELKQNHYTSFFFHSHYGRHDKHGGYTFVCFEGMAEVLQNSSVSTRRVKKSPTGDMSDSSMELTNYGWARFRRLDGERRSVSFFFVTL
jgi:hypothetical protein